MPANTVSVARPGKWGTPFKVGGRTVKVGKCVYEIDGGVPDNGFAVSAFHINLLRGFLAISIDDVKRDLRGKNLACWCKPGEPCHADVLLSIANE